jgi:glycosyltransferase involved in cell wall biosynthesis
MNILWLTWKDLSHPHAGGAEIVNEQIAKRLVNDGHKVIFITSNYGNNTVIDDEHRNGYRIIRRGNRLNVYWKTYRYYKKYMRGWADLVIDEVNTIPYFAKFYVDEPNIMFTHMLCREIWFYELKQPFSSIGYISEPLYMRLLRDRSVITVSESTKLDLERFGFKANNIHIISEGLKKGGPKSIPLLSLKSKNPTLLSLSSIRPMKRTLDQIKAFDIAKTKIPNLSLEIAGDSTGTYGHKLQHAIENSKFKRDIHYHGKVSETVRVKLMRKSHCIMVTSVKEGWGLVVTEANSQGTPAVAYDVDGLRDSVINGETGYLTSINNPDSLAENIVKLLSNKKQYNKIRNSAFEHSKSITFDKSYNDFKEAINL